MKSTERASGAWSGEIAAFQVTFAFRTLIIIDKNCQISISTLSRQGTRLKSLEIPIKPQFKTNAPSIWTHECEHIRALFWRLGPLGHDHFFHSQQFSVKIHVPARALRPFVSVLLIWNLKANWRTCHSYLLWTGSLSSVGFGIANRWFNQGAILCFA